MTADQTKRFHGEQVSEKRLPYQSLGGEIKPALAQRRFAAMEGWRLGGWNGGYESIINPVLYFLETYYHPRFRYFETGPISFYSIRSR